MSLNYQYYNYRRYPKAKQIWVNNVGYLLFGYNDNYGYLGYNFESCKNYTFILYYFDPLLSRVTRNLQLDNTKSHSSGYKMNT